MRDDPNDLYGLLEDSQLVQQRIYKRTQRKLRDLTKLSKWPGSPPRYLEELVDREYARIAAQEVS